MSSVYGRLRLQRMRQEAEAELVTASERLAQVRAGWWRGAYTDQEWKEAHWPVGYLRKRIKAIDAELAAINRRVRRLVASD